MIRGFCFKWSRSSLKRHKVTRFLTQNTNFGKCSDQNLKQLLGNVLALEFLELLLSTKTSSRKTELSQLPSEAKHEGLSCSGHGKRNGENYCTHQQIIQIGEFIECHRLRDLKRS